jgi:hypothetical protein
MYYSIVAALMFVLPLLSIGVEAMHAAVLLTAALVAKWFVFWSVGLRLLLAGLRQTFQPEYTAREILGLKGDESLVLVRELGFANIAMGAVGTISLFLPTWRLPGALAGGLFYALAGVNHVRQSHRNRLENVAMVSDLWAAAVLLGVCAAVGLGG